MKPEMVLTWKDVEHCCADICRDILLSDWRPDYVVGITRGGAAPAVLISQYLSVPCHMLSVSLRDGGDTEHNGWMAEDAFGYVPATDNDYSWTRTDPGRRRRILIVDDINDSGATVNWIKDDWQGGCLPDEAAWQDIWGQNVRFAMIVDNQSSQFQDTDYAGIEINKAEQDVWVVFPWEAWWRR